MSVCPPPWEELTMDDISHRLIAIASSKSSPFNIRSCFSRDSVFSTGNNIIDRLLPDGGIACGSVLEIFGPPAAGKSYIVREMIINFAIRGILEWTRIIDTEIEKDVSENHNNNNNSFKKNRGEEINEDDEFRPNDWCIFLILSDPSSLCLTHLYELLKNSLNSTLSDKVKYGDEHDKITEQLLMQRVKIIYITTPNELLVFFRFLSRVEFINSQHHNKRRRVLVILDSLARFWEHPSCGATTHARNWFAAELVREIRQCIITGNGWRDIVYPSHKDSSSIFNNNNNNNNAGGGVAIVIVNGCTCLYSQNYRKQQLQEQQQQIMVPLGLPVWCAAAADFRLYIEPVESSDAFIPQSCNCNNNSYNNNNNNNSDMCCSCSTEQSGIKSKAAKMKVRLVKGGCGEVIV